MSTFYTTFLSKSDFSFALLLVTFEPLDIQQSYIPLLKALMCGINAVGAQGSGCMFTLCHAPLKMAVLLHKTEKVCRVMNTAVCLITISDYTSVILFATIFMVNPVLNNKME